MILCFEFELANDSLGFFIKFYAQKSGLKFGMSKQAGRINLYVSGEQEQLLSFSDELALSLPHSVFLHSSRVFVAQNLESEETKFSNNFSNITPNMVLKFHQDELMPCENGILSDVSVWREGEFKAVNSLNFSELLEFAVSAFMSGEGLKFRDTGGEFELLNFRELGSEFDLIMPTNLKNLPKVFICDKQEQVALASYEKPAVTLRTSALYRQNHPNSPRFFKVIAARDIFIYAFCERLLKSGVNFIAVKSRTAPFEAVCLENEYLFLGSRAYYSATNLELMRNSEDKNLSAFKQSVISFGFDKNPVLRLFLSKHKDDEIMIYRAKDSFSVLNLTLPSSFERLFELIKAQDGGDRLTANFSKDFALPSGKIEAPHNFFGLFCVVGKVLGFDENLLQAGEKLLQNASDFSGAKGPRLDFKMLTKSEFNVIKLIRSAMSFRLAGVDDKILSYGCIESFIYFLSEICDTFKEDFGVKGGVFQGELFSCKALSNLALKHIRLSLDMKFSKEFLIEEMF